LGNRINEGGNSQRVFNKCFTNQKLLLESKFQGLNFLLNSHEKTPTFNSFSIVYDILGIITSKSPIVKSNNQCFSLSVFFEYALNMDLKHFSKSIFIIIRHCWLK